MPIRVRILSFGQKVKGVHFIMEISHWAETLSQKLQKTFGENLLFVGLQGSHQRGEATPESDIDMVVILEEVGTEVLMQYKALLATQPGAEKACGFIGSKEALRHWPKFEIFQMARDTRPIHGNLAGLLPPLGREDAAEGLQVGASALYHAACHSFLYGKSPSEEAVKFLYRQALFLLQLQHYLSTGFYAPSRQALLSRLEGEEREILAIYQNWEMHRASCREAPAPYFEKLIALSQNALKASSAS